MAIFRPEKANIFATMRNYAMKFGTNLFGHILLWSLVRIKYGNKGNVNSENRSEKNVILRNIPDFEKNKNPPNDEASRPLASAASPSAARSITAVHLRLVELLRKRDRSKCSGWLWKCQSITSYFIFV